MSRVCSERLRNLLFDALLLSVFGTEPPLCPLFSHFAPLGVLFIDPARRVIALNRFLEALTGFRPDGADQVITEAVFDSRHVIPGSMFVALPGERVDGHDFVISAFQSGASLALVQRAISERYQLLDLRSEAASFPTIPEIPFCLLVILALLMTTSGLE